MAIKYTKDITDRLIAEYLAGATAVQLAERLSTEHNEEVPERSVIAKLASLGVYKKKTYTNKRGETPIKKEEYIERIAVLLDVNAEMLESLEKVNKAVLALIERKLEGEEEPEPPKPARRQTDPKSDKPINFFG